MEDRPPPEAELVTAARLGDQAAFGQLVSAYQEVAFRTAYLVTGDAGEAEDAAQEAFVKAYHALDRFRDGAALRPWLLRIVANTASNRRRSANRRLGLEFRAQVEVTRPASAPSAESIVVSDEERRELLQAVNSLDPDDRLVLGARYFLDLPEGEIAALAGVARGTVKSRLSRARARLAKRIAEIEDRANG